MPELHFFDCITWSFEVYLHKHHAFLANQNVAAFLNAAFGRKKGMDHPL
jgi:hypothetical protein